MGFLSGKIKLVPKWWIVRYDIRKSEGREEEEKKLDRKVEMTNDVGTCAYNVSCGACKKDHSKKKF